MIRKAKIYLLGMREYRVTLTTSFDDDSDLDTYDAGREMAHRLTRRRFDETYL